MTEEMVSNTPYSPKSFISPCGNDLVAHYVSESSSKDTSTKDSTTACFKTDVSTQCNDFQNCDFEAHKKENISDLHKHIRRLSLDEDSMQYEEIIQCASPPQTCSSNFFKIREVPMRTKALHSRCNDVTPISTYAADRKRKRLQTVTNCQFSFTPASKQRFTPRSKRRLSGNKKVVTFGSVVQSGYCLMQQDCLRIESQTINVLASPSVNVQCRLKILEKPQIVSAAFQSIGGEELVRIMEAESESETKSYIIIDCRYPYEYDGGHIRGAVNIHDPTRLEEIFFPEDENAFKEIITKIPIFYCEFSQKRGPTGAEYLRRIDRMKNEDKYPELTYNEIYLLDRGYKNFYEDGKFAEFCEPVGYTRMVATPFRMCLKKYHMHRSRNVVRPALTAHKKSPYMYARCRLRKFYRRSVESPMQFRRKIVTPCRKLNRLSLKPASESGLPFSLSPR